MRERDHLEDPRRSWEDNSKRNLQKLMGTWTGNLLTSSEPVSCSGRTVLHGVSEIVHSRAGITNWPKQQAECTRSTPDVAGAIWFRLLIRER